MIIQNDLLIFNEGETVVSSDIICKLSGFDNLYIRSDKKIIFDTVGFQMNKNYTVIVFPKGYSCNTNQINDDLQLIILILKNFKNNNKYSNFNLDIRNNIDESFLYSCFFIYDFWKKNGDYFEYKTKLDKYNISKIDWPNTIKNSSLLSLENYLDIYGVRLLRDYESDFSSIFNDALFISINHLKSLITFKNNIKKTKMKSIQESKYIINKIRRETFNSSKIELLNHIENIILGTSKFKIDSNEFFVYTKYFNIIWEQIIAKLLKSEYSTLYDLVPNIFINLTSRYSNSPIEYRQIPDILYISNNEVKIVDAKYYDIEHTFPGKDDFLKQFFYDITLKTSLVKRNYMIFCGNEKNKSLKIGNVKIEKIDSEFTQLNEIDLYVFDTKQAIENYLFHLTTSDYRKELL